MGRPLKGTRPTVDPSLTEAFWERLTGNPQPSQREQFLWLSIDLVRTLGLSQFRITTVARQLGYSVAMVNHHFGSRDGLVAEGAATVHAAYSARLIDATESAPANPRARLDAYVRARIEHGRSLGGWSQVLNYPAQSFESPQIAMARAGQGFEDSFHNNLRYLTQLIVDYRAGSVSNTTFDGDDFPHNALAHDPVAFLHSSHIGTSTSGIVMWLAGRIDSGTHTPALLDVTKSTVDKLVTLVVDAIPVDPR